MLQFFDLAQVLSSVARKLARGCCLRTHTPSLVMPIEGCLIAQ